MTIKDLSKQEEIIELHLRALSDKEFCHEYMKTKITHLLNDDEFLEFARKYFEVDEVVKDV